MNKYIKMFILNLSICIFAIVGYSPGLLNLRLSDISIFRAGMSILLGIILFILFLAGNYYLLREPFKKEIHKEDIKNLDSAKKMFILYSSDKYYRDIANTAIEQITRLSKSINRAKMSIDNKFDKASMSWNKYYNVLDAGENTAISNIVFMANRMQLFDSSDYLRLQNYKDDDIPDDIQEKQLELYEKNITMINNAIALNEQLLLKLDMLSMELASTIDSDDSNTALLDEISKLTEEAKYYL